MAKKYILSKLSGNKGESKASLLFTENHFLVRSQFQNDFGVDIEIEHTTAENTEDRIATGLLAKVQVKHRQEKVGQMTLSLEEVQYYQGLRNIPLFYIVITESNQYSICHYDPAARNILTFHQYYDLYVINENRVSINTEQIDWLISVIKDHRVKIEYSIITNVLRSTYKAMTRTGDEGDVFGMIKDEIIQDRANHSRIYPDDYKAKLLELSGNDQGLRKLLEF